MVDWIVAVAQVVAQLIIMFVPDLGEVELVGKIAKFSYDCTRVWLAAIAIHPTCEDTDNLTQFDRDYCRKDTGGTCEVINCYEWRGPSICDVDGTCKCQPNYCTPRTSYYGGHCAKKADSQELQDVAPPHCFDDTGGTCRVFGCSSSRGKAYCQEGRCLCRSGYCATATSYWSGTCVPKGSQCDWWQQTEGR